MGLNRRLVGLMRKDVIRGILNRNDVTIVLINKEKFFDEHNKKIKSLIVQPVEYRPVGRIIALGRFLPAQVQQTPYTQQYRPLIMGVSVGNSCITAGTIGYFTQFATPSGTQNAVVSNAHVLTYNPLLSSQPKTCKAITQPGPYDICNANCPGSCASNQYQMCCCDQDLSPYVIGTLTKYVRVKPLTFRCLILYWLGLGSLCENKVDAAYATLSPGVQFNPYVIINNQQTKPNNPLIGLVFAGDTQSGMGFVIKINNIISELGAVPVGYDTGVANVDDTVFKTGRTTGYTEGVVESADATISVWYETGIALFTDVYAINPASGYNAFVQPGDSGSPTFKK
jgi:hypothetical protein